ncbi:MAG TPA: glycosyltransferase family A protein [Solirubrobacteraceae bacterium]|nr:glycosyltransferase family A protein [Solirubrobacteraceae bacterium]
MRKLSVLLPTRNRLEYLRFAIATVLRQDSPDWEIVISDNASEEDIGAYVAELDDPRIVYRRSDEFVPVTENWNRALALASGDFVVMLGDDDGLLPGYVRRIGELAAMFNEPDLIYTGALLLTYPGVTPAHPDGFVASESYASFMQGRDAPFLLAPPAARRMVEHAMHFRLRYGFNMQFAVVSRTLIERLAPHGPFFQAAFPDYYAMNVSFLNARSIAVDPQHRVVIGVTPKSYGFYHAQARESEGREFLDATREPAPPGTNINVGWLSAIEAIEHEYGARSGLRADRRRYRLLQALNVYERYRFGDDVDSEELARMDSALGPVERIVMRAASAAAAGVAPALPARMRGALTYLFRRAVRQYPHWTPPQIEGRYANILELFEAAQAGDVLAGGGGMGTRR